MSFCSKLPGASAGSKSNGAGSGKRCFLRFFCFCGGAERFFCLGGGAGRFLCLGGGAGRFRSNCMYGGCLGGGGCRNAFSAWEVGPGGFFAWEVGPDGFVQTACMVVVWEEEVVGMPHSGDGLVHSNVRLGNTVRLLCTECRMGCIALELDLGQSAPEESGAENRTSKYRL
eukprot:602217_1